MKTTFMEIPTARSVDGVGLCLSQEEFDEAASRLGILEPAEYSKPGGAKAWTMVNEENHLYALVCVGEDLQKSPQHIIYGLLAHEAVHVWQAFRDSIGEERPGIEQEAYGIGQICEALFEEYAKRTAPTARKKKQTNNKAS